MLMLGLCITLLCVCVCVDYICLLLYVVVYVIVSMCVYDDTCAAWQIRGCLQNICVAMCSGSRKAVEYFKNCVCRDDFN